jgi:hypothetical protein
MRPLTLKGPKMDPLSQPKDVGKNEKIKKSSSETSEKTVASIKEFYPKLNANSYCFSCFDPLEFSGDQSCQEVLEILFQRYGLGDAEACRQYEVKLLTRQGHAEKRISLG